MKKKLLAVLIVLLICAVALPTTAFALANTASTETQSTTPVEISPDYSWYSTDATEYTINSAEQLAALGKLTQGNVVVGETTLEKTDFKDKTVKLGADITFAENQYWYVRNADGKVVFDYCIKEFAGTFNGNEHTIYGLKFKSGVGTSAIGLFQNFAATGSIMKVILDGVSFDLKDANNTIGSLAARLYGTATNCHVKNVTVVVGMNTAKRGYIQTGGGMFAYVKSATVTGCTATTVNMSFSGEDNTDGVGALIGRADGTADSRTTIADCTVSDAVFYCTCKTKHFGAFVGQTNQTEMTNCHISDIDITTLDYSYNTGGFVGNVGSGSVYQNCTVSDFKMTDMSSGPYYYSGNIGGFAGYVGGTEVSFTDCTATELDFDLEFANDYSCGVGGFAGQMGSNGATITSCAASGAIAANGGNSDIPVGGFIGESHGGLIISGCETSVDVTAPDMAGGFIGACNKGEDTYTDCVATGSVTSTNVAAGGFVGYVQNNAAPTFGEGCVASPTVNGPITSKIANAQDKSYEIDSNGNITSEPTNWVCSVKLNPSYFKGYSSIQEAVNTGASTVTLLADSTEDFVLDRTETDSFILELGSFTYNGIITVPNEIKSFTAKGTSDNNSIVLTEPFKNHCLFNGWCNGIDNTQNIAPKVDNGWLINVGETYHTHWTESLYEHLTFEQLHPDFGEMIYGDKIPEAKYVTFVKKDATDEDYITDFTAEAGNFDVSFNGLTLTITPKEKLDVGTYEEIIHVRVSDGSTHGVTAKITIKKSQAFIDIDTSDIVVVQGEEWQLPSASTNLGLVVTDKNVDDMNEVGVYTVTYSVEGTDNYEGDSKQIKVTVILNPTTIQENLDKAVQDLNAAINNKASSAELQTAIDNLETAYKAADTALKAALQNKIDADVSALKSTLEVADTALQTAINNVADGLKNAVSELNNAITKGDTALDGKITALETAYKAANVLISSNISDLIAEDTEIKTSITALESSIATVKSELEASLKAVQDKLEKAISDGDKDLQDKIYSIEASLSNAKNDFESAISEMQKNLDDINDKLTQKDNELHSKISILTVILSIVGIASVFSFAVIIVIFVKKHKI